MSSKEFYALIDGVLLNNLGSMQRKSMHESGRILMP